MAAGVTILDFWSEWFKVFFIYKSVEVTLILPVKVHVNWPYCSEGSKQIFKLATVGSVLDFQSEQINYFWSTSHQDTSYHVSSKLAFCFWRSSAKYISKTAATAAILDFWSKQS